MKVPPGIEVGNKYADRMFAALLEIGYSKHTGQRRFGPKAQTARWGLGADTHPDDTHPEDVRP